MKIFCFLLGLFTFFNTEAQTKKTNTENELPPVYYVDSIKMMSMPCMDPNKIAAIDIVKEDDPVTKAQYRVNIKTKNTNDFKFLTMEDIAVSNKIDNSAPVIFMLNNDFLNDVDALRIDSSYILTVRITKASELKYLKDAVPGLTIINILTKTQENIDQQSKIKIKGTESTASTL